MDLGIAGKGYFVVRDGANDFATRDGAFHFDSTGNLVNAQGKNVLSAAGAVITVPNWANVSTVSIGLDGTITASYNDGSPDDTSQQIGLLPVDDESKLVKQANNLFDFGSAAVIGSLAAPAAGDNRNAALYYWRALYSLDRDFQRQTGDLLQHDRTADWAPPESTVAKLKENRDFITQLLQASRIDKCDFGIAYDEGFMALLPHVGPLRSGARILAMDAHRLMAENIRSELKRRGVDKEIISSDGTCIVHDEFDVAAIADARARFPGLKVVAHPECEPDVAAAADFVGSTGAMMKYVKNTVAPYFLMLTECGLVGRLQVEAPPLIRAYLRLGAKLLGPPAWDPDFNTADLPMLMRIQDLPARYRKHFLGA